MRLTTVTNISYATDNGSGVFLCLWAWPVLLCLSPSQVGGSLSVLPLSGLSHGHVYTLQPLFRVLLVLSLQHVRLTVCEDLKGARQAAITPLLGYHLWKKTMGESVMTVSGIPIYKVDVKNMRLGTLLSKHNTKGCGIRAMWASESVTTHLDTLHLAQLDRDVIQFIFLQGGWKTRD